MTEAELANAVSWYGFWSKIEHWAFLAVVVALAIEFAALKFGDPYKEKIDHERAVQLAKAQKAADDAKLALEKFKAPRTLSPVQQEEIAAKLKPFGSLPFDFAVFNDPEPVALMEQIALALKSAGWVRKPSEVSVGFNPVGGGPKVGVGAVNITGIFIQITTSRLPDWGEGSKALRDALKAADLETSGFAIEDATENPNAIHIYIGKKPQ